MIISKEKSKFVKELSQTRFVDFKAAIRSLNYDDYERFIHQFLEDTEYLFTFCNKRKYQNLFKNYNGELNMFDKE